MLQKQRTKRVRSFFIAGILLSGTVSFAQVLSPDMPANRALILVEEQYNQGHYALAARSARQVINNNDSSSIYPRQDADMDKAKYFLALAQVKTDVQDAEPYAVAEMQATTNEAYRQRLGFTLAQYYFRHDMMSKAIPLYESAGISNLDNKEIADAKFELAYCYFNNRQFDKAEPLLLAIKELKDGKYYMAGNYYYGLLAYNENKYKQALQSFDRIKDEKEYSAIVPYYIAEIYYFSGARDKAQKLAEELIKRKEKSFYDNELHLLEAQCLFENALYREAKPYFEYYYQHKDKIRKQELYEMAYCDYKTDDWNAAVDKFKLLSGTSDSLGQTAMYLLGDCYLKTEDKPSARNAFGICADMSFNKGQQEAAMFLYGKISYETGFNDEALRQLRNLLKTFPSTGNKDEANTMISSLLLKTNDYDGALVHLKEVSHRQGDYWSVYQKAAYGYAVQQYRAGKVKDAQEYFDLSLQHPVNADYERATYFWKSELAYQSHKYAEVITYAQDFIDKKTGKGGVEHISPQATPQHAYLNMGFAAMQQQDYTAAQDYFSKAQQEPSQDAYTGMMATLREADAVFMQKNFGRAITLYDKIINSGNADADYASYQKAIILGLQGKNNEKIVLLHSIISTAPPSAYADHARYEIAITYLESDKYPQALAYLHQLTDSVSDKSFAPSAWMKTGFIYQQMNDNSKAINAYRHVVKDYPGADDRLAALDALKSLYILSNQPAEYTRMLKESGLPSADSSSVDSTYYAAAETQFSNGKLDDAATAFSNYLQQYPNGIFAIKAHYYRGESYYNLKKYKEARADYDKVLAGPWNDFYENSARHAAAIAYQDKDYAGAFGYYTKLRSTADNDVVRMLAYEGLVKSGYNANRYHEAASYADSLIAMPGVQDETINDVLYYKAKSLQQYDSSDAALTIYQQLSKNKNGDIAAEARYRISEIYLEKGKLKEAEAAANETIHLSSGYDYWIVKSYLLLADVLVQEKDFFNAKATLESIVKHTKIAEAKEEAQKKLEEVKALEKKQSKLSEE
jgi:tetratricopeptide (TPR) repeat protein